MRKFKVYRRVWGRGVKRKMLDYETGQVRDTVVFPVEMEPTMTINAKTPEAALRIAKQKGVPCPIIGEANEKAT